MQTKLKNGRYSTPIARVNLAKRISSDIIALMEHYSSVGSSKKCLIMRNLIKAKNNVCNIALAEIEVAIERKAKESI